MGVYEDLGVRPVINAIGTNTRYGGSLMASEVLDIMREASQEFCLLDELHVKAGAKIAAMLDVEAAYVTASAACGLVITTAACMTGTDPDKIRQLPDTTGLKYEVIIQKRHRIAYDQAIRLTGARLIEIEDSARAPIEAMRAAINERTVAMFYLGKEINHPHSVPLHQVIEMAHAASVPVIVDAASECPPLSTLTRFSKAGVDLVIFSGGKSLSGPQSTGLLLGRKDLINACAANGTPFATVGRPMKISREEIIAFIKALELYLARDHDADITGWKAKISYIQDRLADVPHIEMEQKVDSETYIVSKLIIHIKPDAGITGDEAIKALLDGEPRIVVGQDDAENGFTINPHNLQPGQEQIVADRCRAVLTVPG